MSEAIRVLIAEDRPEDAELLVLELCRAGYEVNHAVAATADAFRAELGRGPWDLVLSDYAMGPFTAPAAYAILKEREQDIPFIIVSGTIGEATAVEAMRAGAHDFLLKGNLVRLGPVVARELREAKNRRERRAEERASRAAAEYQAMLLDNLHDAVIGLDAHLTITAWNLAAERVYGYSREEALGRGLEGLLPAEYAQGTSLESVAAQTAREGLLRLELRHRARGGEWLDIEATAVVMHQPDGSLLGYVLVNRDITARNRAVAALRESQERLQRILETSNEGIWVADAEGRTEFANARLAEMFGIRGPMVGRLIAELVPESLRPLVSEDLEALGHNDRVQRVIRLNRSNRPDIWLALSTSLVRGPDGALAGFVAIFMDVTEDRRSREQLLQSQKMEAVGQLASGIAHDFNNLLVSILSNASFLAENLPEGEQREDAREILEAGERAAGLTRQLLTFSRKQILQPEPIDLNRQLENLHRMLGRIIGENIHLQERLAPSLGLVMADRGQIDQVVLNLVLNARDAMPGGGYLTIETANVDLDPENAGLLGGGVRPGPYVMLAIRDSGFGMDSQIKAHLFEPFFTTKGPGKGTGLGLSTVFGIVKQSQGHISVESEPGRGTCFRIYLPRAEGNVLRRGGEESGGAPNEGGTVLVVEDELAVRRLTTRTLERAGYKTLAAADGEEALVLAERHPGEIHLLLTDVIMPHMNGRILAERLTKSRASLKVLYMSGYTGTAMEQQGVLDPGVHLLGKPFDRGALLAKVHEVLGERRLDQPAHPEPAPKAEAKTAQPCRDDLAAIPLSLRVELRRTAERARLDDLAALLEQLQAVSPEVAQHLQVLMDDFDYDGILEFIPAEVPHDG